MWRPIPRRSGIRAARVAAALTLWVALAGCNYSFRAGAGFPDYIRTMAVLPFENETNRFELTDEIHREMLQSLPRALGIQPAGENVADAVVRGTIRTYQVSTPSFRPSAGGDRADVLQREVRIGLEVQIVDLERGVILWEDRGLSARGQYLEAGETEDVARAEAVELLVQAIVDGAQSNW